MQRLSWRALVGRSRVRGTRFRAGRRIAGMPVSERALKLAAEVLEPRCLLTDSAGIEFTRSGSTVVVPASQWRDDGLTLVVRSDSFEIGHTDESAMTVIPFESASRLVLQGRNQAADELSVRFHASPAERVPRIEFDGGTGSKPDRLRFDYGQTECRIEPQPNRSGSISLAESLDAIESGVEAWMLSYRDVEWVRDESRCDHRVVQFGSENNVVAFSQVDGSSFLQLNDLATGAVIEARYWNEINGGAGNDHITASDAAIGEWVAALDIVRGEAGNDTLIGSDWFAELFGGDGDDRLVGNLLHGDAGNDTLEGLTETDALHGGLGNDLLRGGEHGDALFGESGNDTLEGGDSDDGSGSYDWLFGGDGDDVLRGGDGADILIGEMGNDSLEGDAGADWLIGGNDFYGDFWWSYSEETYVPDTRIDTGRDTLRGGSGDDQLEGNAGNDALFGDAGGDFLFGGLGNDKLDGGDDGDELRGEEGNDSLFGGNGHDDLYEEFGSNLLDGGEGIDHLTIERNDDSLPVESNTLLGQAGNDSLKGGYGNDLLSGGDGRDTLDGDLGKDTLRGDAGNDSLDGGEGSDLLDGGSERDRLYDEGAETNTLRGGAGNDWLSVDGDGRNLLEGGAGHDLLEGSYGRETLLGGDGNDYLIGYYGADWLDGGPGRDKLLAEYDDRGQSDDRLLNGEIPELESWDYEFVDIDLDAEASTETIITAADWTDAGLTVAWNDGQLIVSHTDTGERIYQSSDWFSVDRWLIQGRDNASDRLTVSVSLVHAFGRTTSELPAVLFDGGGGADELQLIGELQRIDEASFVVLEPHRNSSGWVRVSDDRRWNGDDQPLISYRNVELILDEASSGVENLQFGPDNNDVEFHSIRSPSEDDFLYEVVDRATGNTIRFPKAREFVAMTLGAGNDRVVIRDVDSERHFYVDGEAGNDTLRLDSDCRSCDLNGGDGDDSLQGSDGPNALYGDAGNDTLNGLGGEDLLEGNDGDDLLLGGDGEDLLEGDEGSDTLFGEGSNDRLEGNEGDDLLNGGDGDDTLRGFEGDDTLQGANGDDWLYGSEGANRLEGGPGDDDLKIYEGWDGPDQIWSNTLLGQAGHDMLQGGPGDDLLSGGDGQDFLEGRGGNDTLRGDANPDQLEGGDGNDLLEGGDARDTLNGGADNDTLRGGAANDRLFEFEGNNLLDGGAGHDQLEAGEGRDTLRGGTGDDWLIGGLDVDQLDGGAGQDQLWGNNGPDDNDSGDRLLNGELRDFAIDYWPAAETDIDWDMELTTVILATAADWTDAGLTLSCASSYYGMLLLQRTDTGEDVIEPFYPNPGDRYMILGRDGRDDVLTVDLSDPMSLQNIVFVAGVNGADELRFANEWWTPRRELTIQPQAGNASVGNGRSSDGSVWWDGYDYDGWSLSRGAIPSLKYSNVETIVCDVQADTTTIQFGDEANNIVLDADTTDSLWRLTDSVTHASIWLSPPTGGEALIVEAGGGNDLITLRPPAVRDDFDHVVTINGGDVLLDDGFVDDESNEVPIKSRKQSQPQTSSRHQESDAIEQEVLNTITVDGFLPVVSLAGQLDSGQPEFLVLTGAWPNAAAEIELTEAFTPPPRSMMSVVEVSDEEPFDSAEPHAAVTTLETLAPADIDQLLSDANLLDGLM